MKSEALHELYEGRPATPRAGGEAMTMAASPISSKILRLIKERGVLEMTAPESDEVRAMQIAPGGRALLVVADTIDEWLSQGPQTPVRVGDALAESIVHAFLAGWESTLLWAVAGRPRTLAELEAEIEDAELESKLVAMRRAGLVKGVPKGVFTAGAFVATEWARRGVGPLLTAVRCELRSGGRKALPLTAPELSAALTLATPLATVHGQASLEIFLTVAAGKVSRQLAKGLPGTHVEVVDGAVASCSARTETKPPTWVAGSIEAWLEALLGDRAKRLRYEGEKPALARDLVESLHHTLFVPGPAAPGRES